MIGGDEGFEEIFVVGPEKAVLPRAGRIQTELQTRRPDRLVKPEGSGKRLEKGKLVEPALPR